MDEGHGNESDEESPVRAPDSVSPSESEERPSSKGIPPIAEALGYVGGALAVAAVIALLIRYWAGLGPYGHVGVGLVLAAAGLVGGFLLERYEGDAARRLSQFLLVAGVVGIGIAAGFATRRIGFLANPTVVRTTSEFESSLSEWSWFVGMTAAAVAAGLIWRRRQSVLQHLAFGGAVAAAALLSLPLMPFDGPDWGFGATLVAVALVWGALSLRDMLPPRSVGLVLASLGLAGGIEMMAVSADPMLLWALWLGAAVCAGLIYAGAHAEELGVLGVGTVGLMVFSAELVADLLGFGAGTAIALIAFGFVLLGAAVRLTLTMPPEAGTNRRIASEVAGYLGVALALGGAGILMAQYWEELGVAGHIAVPLVGVVVAYVCALLLERSETAAARRLSQTLLAIGILAAGILGAMVAQPIAERIFGVFVPSQTEVFYQPDHVSNWTGLIGTLTAALVGGVTWWLRKGALTQAMFVSALAATVMAATNFGQPYNMNTNILVAGVTLTALGTLWVAFGSMGRITPVRTALVMGCLVALMGLQMASRGDSGDLNTWAAVLGLGFGVAGIVASTFLKRAILLGFGAVYIMIFATTLVMDLFGGRGGAPVVLLVTGVLFIVLAVVAARIAPRLRSTPKAPRPPEAPIVQT